MDSAYGFGDLVAESLAIIGEGSYARYLNGQADDPVFATYDLRIPQMAEVAWSLCEKAG